MLSSAGHHQFQSLLDRHQVYCAALKSAQNEGLSRITCRSMAADARRQQLAFYL